MASQFERARREEHIKLHSVAGRFALKDYSKLEYLPKTLKAKRITVYVNGDTTRGGTQFPVPNTCKKWPKFLELVTRTLGMLGQCHSIYTHEGKRIHNLEGIQHGYVYIAAGNEPFKKLAYNPSAVNHLDAPKPTLKAGFRKSELDYDDRMDRLHGCFAVKKIRVYTVSPGTPGVEFLVTAKDQLSFEYFLSRLGDKVKLPPGNGAIRGLYDMDGIEINSSDHLQSGQWYIAVGNFNAGPKAVMRRIWQLSATGKAPASTSPTPLPQLASTAKQGGKGGGADGDAYQSLRVENMIKKKDQVLNLATDKKSMAVLWKRIDGKWVDSSRNPAASLQAIIAAVGKRFPGFDLPYAWDVAYNIHLEDRNNTRRTVSVGTAIHRDELGMLLRTAVHVHIAMIAMDDRGGHDSVGYVYSDFDELLVNAVSAVGYKPVKSKKKVFASIAQCNLRAVDTATARRTDVYAWYAHSEQLDRFPSTEVGGDRKPGEEVWSFSSESGEPDQGAAVATQRAVRMASAPCHVPINPITKRTKKAHKSLLGSFQHDESVMRDILHSAFIADEFFELMDNDSNDILDAQKIEASLKSEFKLLHSRAALQLACRINNRRKVAVGIKATTNGDDMDIRDVWVTEPEFAEFLRNVFYFNKVFQLCGIDELTSESYINFGDYKIFQNRVLGLRMSDKKAFENFNSLLRAQNQVLGEGLLLLDTLCLWYAESQYPRSLLAQITLGQPPPPLVRSRGSISGAQENGGGRANFSNAFQDELTLLATVEKKLDSDHVDTFDVLSDWLNQALSPEYVGAGLDSYASLNARQVRDIVSRITGFTPEQISEYVDSYLPRSMSTSGQHGLNSLLALCAVMTKLPASLLAWQQRFSVRFCVRAGRKICPAVKRSEVTRYIKDIAQHEASSGQSLDPHSFVKWCVDTLFEPHRTHLVFVDTERAMLRLGSDEALSKLLHLCEHDIEGNVQRLSQLYAVVSDKIPLLNNLSAYKIAFQYVTGRKGEPLMRIDGFVRDCGDTSLSPKHFRRFIFCLLCLHKIASTLRIDLNILISDGDNQEYVLSYGEFCMGLDCIGVEPTPPKEYLGRATDFMNMRFNRPMGFETKANGGSSAYTAEATIESGKVTLEKLVIHCARQLFQTAQHDSAELAMLQASIDAGSD